MLRAVVSSDWHLESLKRHFPFDHIERQIKELDKIYQYCIDHGIEHLFVPGDICDTSRMDYRTYIALMDLLHKYDGLVNTYYMAGNHDFSDKHTTSLDLLEYYQHKKMFKTFHLYSQPEQIEIDGVLINMLPHPSTESIKGDRPCINFVHTEINGVIGDNGRKLRVHKKFKTGKGDFTISGHIHQWQYLKKKRWLFCGNPYQKNFGEALPKGFVEIRAKYDDKGKLVVKNRFVDNKPGFRFETKLIECLKDFSDLEANPCIRYRLYVDPSVTVPGDIRVKIPNIAQILNSQGKTLEVLEDVEAFKQDAVSVPKVDPLFGLKAEFKSGGFKKADYLLGKSLVLDALTELNFSV